jgi:hypothetical protein
VHLLDRNGLAADMQPGDIVEVANAGSSTPVSVTVPPLAATVDEVTRTIIGRGPALADVGLQTEYGAAATVRTDAGGAFQAVFPQSSEIGWVQLAYREPQGNWILAQTGQPLAGPAYLAARWDGVSNRYLAHAVAGNAGVSVQSVAVTLRRNGVVVATGATMAAADGDFTVLLQDAAGNSVDIAAGDVIEMAAGAGTRVLTVPLVTAQVNLASGTLYGVGPAYARLLTGGWYCPLLGPTAAAGAVSGATAGPDEPTVDGGGNWVVACDNLRQGAEGYVAVVDADDNLTYVQWHTPHVTVRLNGNEVEGVAAPEAAVRVELRRGAELIAASEVTADESDGWFEVALRASSGTPANIRANDVVVVQYGGQTITVPVTPITAEVDAAADTISGSGPAGKEMDVYAFGMQFEGMVRTVKVSAGGSYTADFREAFDIVNGVALIVDYVNDDGNTVYLRQNAPLVRINLSSDIVDGYAAPNARATLLLKRAAATVATAAAVTNATGSFSAFFLGADGAVVDLTTGDVVEITTEPFVSMGMVGQPLGALGLTAALDPAFDTVAGMGPAGTPILVVVHRCLAGGCFERAMTAIAGSDGAYVANFAGVLDLDATSYAYVQAADAQGNLTSVATAPGATPRLEEVLGRLAGQGATLIATASGTANRGNLTPPLRVTVVGAGKLVLAASGGNLVVTAPDGKVLEPQSSFLTVANPLNGVWLVQVRLAAPVLINNLAPDDLGIQYTIAVGQGLYSVYMPTVKQQHP